MKKGCLVPLDVFVGVFQSEQSFVNPKDPAVETKELRP